MHGPAYDPGAGAGGTGAIQGTMLDSSGEVVDLFNTVVFGGINTNISNAAFGRVSSQANQPRVAQLTFRVDF